MALPRLPWRRSLTGFAAYPNGEQHADQVATIVRDRSRPTDGAQWTWTARYGEAIRYGDARSKQLAADAATAAWPIVVAEAKVLEAKATVHAQLLARLDEIHRSGTVNLEEFAIGTAANDKLLVLITECRKRWEVSYRKGQETVGIERLMNAVSAELFRRRQESSIKGS